MVSRAAKYNADVFYDSRSCVVQERNLNPKPCDTVCVCVREFAREVNIPCRRLLALARSGRLDTENSLYLHSVCTCLLTVRARVHTHESSIDMYNNDVGQESAQKIMKQTGDLKAATLYFAS